MAGQDQTGTIREILLGDLTKVKWLRAIVDMYGEKSNDIFFPSPLHKFFPSPLRKKITTKEPDIVIVDNCGWVYGVKVELIQRGDDYDSSNTDPQD